MKKQLHEGSKWLIRVPFYFFMFIFLIGILILGASSINAFIPFLLLFAIIILAILVEVYVNFYYKTWFYEFTDHQLRLERGVIWKRYSNIPYERVQNVDITRGITARILGFSTVNIQTAGFSSAPNQAAMSEGYIPAVPVSEAEHIREFIMKKITKKGRKQGL